MEYQVSAESVLRVLMIRAQGDPLLAGHIEVAQLEVALNEERARRIALEEPAVDEGGDDD